MTNLTHKSSKVFFGAAMRVVTLALFLVVFGASAALAQTRGLRDEFFRNSVSVIDSATNTVVATIPVGQYTRSAAVTPNGAFAYMSNRLATTCLSDKHGNQYGDCYCTGWNRATGLAITPNGAFVYVTNPSDNSVSVIDTATDTVTVTIPGLPVPRYVAITPNGDFAYVAGLLEVSQS